MGRDKSEPSFDEDKDFGEIWSQVVLQYEKKVTKRKLESGITFKLPNHLRKSAYATLSQLLGVLRTSYELATSKKEVLKTMMGILLFNSDARVADSLELMESRTKDSTNASAYQILVDVRGFAEYL